MNQRFTITLDLITECHEEVSSEEVSNWAQEYFYGSDMGDVTVVKVVEDVSYKSYQLELFAIHKTATAIFRNEELSWEERYDEIFSYTISSRVFVLTKLDYCDPDSSYQEDVTAFMNAFDQKIKELK